MAEQPPLFPKVMLTGHRKFSRDETAWLENELRRTVKRLKAFHGLEEIISGMALGADTLWAELALELNVPLAAYIPFEDQPKAWPQFAQDHWSEIRALASREVVVGPHFSVGYLHARNDAMIRDSSLCVAAYRRSEISGGTASAVKKVRKLQKPMLILDPETRTVTKENFSGPEASLF